MRFENLTSATGIPHRRRTELLRSWKDVTAAGGAVGLPPGVPSDDDVAALAKPLFQRVVDGRAVIVVACDESGAALGWVAIVLNDGPLFAHWAEVQRLQVFPTVQRGGVGSALMEETRRVARDDLGLEQLRLTVRSGHGLEAFYGRLGWAEFGRHPGAIRVGPGDDRDEVFLLLENL